MTKGEMIQTYNDLELTDSFIIFTFKDGHEESHTIDSLTFGMAKNSIISMITRGEIIKVKRI